MNLIVRSWRYRKLVRERTKTPRWLTALSGELSPNQLSSLVTLDFADRPSRTREVFDWAFSELLQTPRGIETLCALPKLSKCIAAIEDPDVERRVRTMLVERGLPGFSDCLDRLFNTYRTERYPLLDKLATFGHLPVPELLTAIGKCRLTDDRKSIVMALKTAGDSEAIPVLLEVVTSACG